MLNVTRSVTQKSFPLWGTTVRSHTLALIASASGRSKSLISRCPFGALNKQSLFGVPQNSLNTKCLRFSLVSIARAAGGTKGTIVPQRGKRSFSNKQSLFGNQRFSGPVAERFKAVVLKTIIANTITSSNLVLPFLVIECFSLCSASTQ